MALFGRVGDDFIGHSPLFRMLGTSLDQAITQRRKCTFKPILAALYATCFGTWACPRLLIPSRSGRNRSYPFLLMLGSGSLNTPTHLERTAAAVIDHTRHRWQ